MLSAILFHVLRGLVGSVLGVACYHLYIHRFQDLGWMDPSELRRGDKLSFSRLVDGCQHETVTGKFSRHESTYPGEGPGTTVVALVQGCNNYYTIPPGQKVRIYRRNP